MRSKPNPEIFEQWCEASDLGEPQPLNLANDMEAQKKERPQDEIYQKFFQKVMAVAGDLKKPISVVISGAKQPYPTIKWDFPKLATLSRFTPATGSHISLLHIDTAESVHIRGGLIRSVRLQRGIKVDLDGCWIGKLHVIGAPTELRIRECWIGTLELGMGTVPILNVKSGSIRSISCPPHDSEKNPLMGSVTFSNVDFPTSRNARLLHGAQGYRNLRAHLEKLENIQAANIIHAAQLATERHDDTKFNWAINWLYRLSSNYGTHPWMPLLWGLFLYVVALGAVFFIDGGATREGFSYAGWETSLMRDDRGGKLVRSMILPLQSIINPLGLLGGLKLVVANSGWGAAILTVQGLVTDALLVMAVLAIRKRFRPR